VRWKLASRIVWAWVLTIPASGLIAALFWYLGRNFLG
jgi:PiT family inorganic phosphate transporter